MAKPFESWVQDLVYNVDVGVGLRLIKLALYVLLVVVIMLVYTATQFTWFRQAEAMEYAQLGRNLRDRGELVTQVVRPATIRFLIENTATETVNAGGETVTRGGDPRFDNHPDILHPPLYPAALAGWFKLMGTEFDYVVRGGKHKPELQAVALCHLFTILTGVFLWLLGRRLFNSQVGLLGMSLFFLSDKVWATSISGLPVTLTACLVTIAIYCAVVAVARGQEEAGAARGLVPLLLSALFCTLAVLTSYGAWVVVPGLALYFGIGLPRRGWGTALALLLLVCAGLTPWVVRNLRVSGAPFGMAPEMVLAGTGMFPDMAYERTLVADESLLDFQTKYKGIRAKFFENLDGYFRQDIRTIGDGILICLFITTFFYRFIRRDVHLFRWCVLLSLLLLLPSAGLYGDRVMALSYLFVPVITLYAVAYFIILLDRLQLPLAIQRMAVTTAVVLLCAGPMLITLMPPKAGYPYPPYNKPVITQVTTLMTEQETVCTDMPWATAWYGGRNSLLLPQTIDEFYEINDFIGNIGGLYFTTVTRNQPYVRGLLTGRDRSWFPVHQGRMPADFPLSQGFPLQNLDQLFITDRNRLEEAGLTR